MGRAAVLGPGPIVVGSGRDCALVLHDSGVSRHHARVSEVEGKFLVEDLGSTNGTHFEGARVTAVTVAPGATLLVGRTSLRVQPEPHGLQVEPSRSQRFGELVGASLVMREVFAVLELAAASDATVLLEGETGTGKELAARAVHEASARRRGPFVAVDCGALPAGLVESELLGHVKGAFTGAMAARKGAFARADGGTLFLDELDSLPLDLQPRLLRALEARRVRPVGGDSEQDVDVRVVAAAQRDLAGAVARGALRPDLYYRLSVVRVSLPPLRARREDIEPIVRELLGRRGLATDGVGGPGLARLMAHDWPGNVRELRNAVERAIALAPGARGFDDLRWQVPGDRSEGTDLEVRPELPFAAAKQVVIDGFERRYLRELWSRSGGNLSAAARAADVDRKHLRNLLRKHGLVPPLVGEDDE
ncbi:MAG: sigma 54-dependent Fis family transcriptional regulator [Myxococcales bacterium]|nr:sigma 54-dependent Fis family transcriptional regulator [Myxococcales bacterium]